MQVRPVPLVIGLLLLAGGAGLYGVGVWDGVIGTTPLDAYPAPGTEPTPVRARVVVDGSPADGRALMDRVATAASASLPQGEYVPSHLDGGSARFVLLVRVEAATATGQTLVVAGPVRLYDASDFGDAVEYELVGVLETREAREPILF